MKAKREVRNYHNKSGVWVGKYKNSHNLPHWHTESELVYVESGDINVFCADSSLSLTTGQACYIPPETIHYMHAQTPETVLVVMMFNYAIIENVLKGNTLTEQKITRDYGIADVYGTIKRELTDKLPFFEQKICDKLQDLFIDIVRSEQTSPRKKDNSTALQLRRLLDKIDKEYTDITFEEACDFMALEQAYFSRYFRRFTGMSFSKYLNYVKIDNAVKQLQIGNLSVTDIALSCGFDSIRTFNRNFKEMTGYAPTELPPDFVMTEYFVHSDENFNPTSTETSLIE